MYLITVHITGSPILLSANITKKSCKTSNAFKLQFKVIINTFLSILTDNAGLGCQCENEGFLIILDSKYFYLFFRIHFSALLPCMVSFIIDDLLFVNKYCK